MPFLKDRNKILRSRSREIEEKTLSTGFRPLFVSKSNGTTYKGQWKSGKKTGFGYLYNPKTKATYMGTMLNNKKHGYGVLSQKASNNVYKIIYYGGWDENHYYSYGVRRELNGNIYEGHFKKGLPHGVGKMLYADGSFYAGEWSENKRHGLGLYIQKDGNRYEGHFKDDEKCGHGRFYNLKNGLLQEGIWEENGNCKVSFVVLMPFRHSAVQPTIYPIPPCNLKLDHERSNSILAQLIEEFPLNYDISYCNFDQ